MQLPTNGKVITFTRIRFSRSTKNITEAPIPSVKLLDGTYMKYDEYKSNKKSDKDGTDNANTTTAEQGVINSEDDLPF